MSPEEMNNVKTDHKTALEFTLAKRTDRSSNSLHICHTQLRHVLTFQTCSFLHSTSLSLNPANAEFGLGVILLSRTKEKKIFDLNNTMFPLFMLQSFFFDDTCTYTPRLHAFVSCASALLGGET